MKRVATFDLETDGFLTDVTIVWCCVVKDHTTNQVFKFTPDIIHTLPAFLETYDVLIGHNSIAFDFPVLRKLYGWEYGGIKVDTLLMSRMQRPNRSKPTGSEAGPHSVESWGVRLGHGKRAHDDWARFSPEMMKRCEQDVEIQKLIYDALLSEGAGEGWTNAHKLNHRLFHYLQRQEEYGWWIDQSWMQHCLSTLDRWTEKIDKSVAPSLPLIVEILETKKDGEYNYVRKPFKKDGTYSKATESFLISYKDIPIWCGVGVVGPFSRVGFRPVDLDKNLEVKNFLLAQGWQPDEWNTNDIGEKTSPKLSKDDSFRGIQGGLGKLIAKRVQCKQRSGIIKGWKENIREDGRLSALVGGMATTGRLRHKGIVNVPSPTTRSFFAGWMRKIFSSAPGMVLVGCDSKGNQVRQLAARMGDEEFTKSVLYGKKEDGTDLHSVNMRRASLSNRTLAKNFFYGFLFGAGDTKIGKVIGRGAREGKALKEEYLNNLPLLRELINRETDAWRKTAKKWWNKRYDRMEYRDGYITGLDGRPILVDSEHKVLVYLLQSDEAIHMAAAYVWFNKQMERAGYKWGIDYGCVIWMHDEFQVEVKEEHAEQVAYIAECSIKWAGEFYNIACPHEGEAVIGKNWMETH